MYGRMLHGVTSYLRGGTQDISGFSAVVRSRKEHTTATKALATSGNSARGSLGSTMERRASLFSGRLVNAYIRFWELDSRHVCRYSAESGCGHRSYVPT